MSGNRSAFLAPWKNISDRGRCHFRHSSGNDSYFILEGKGKSGSRHQMDIEDNFADGSRTSWIWHEPWSDFADRKAVIANYHLYNQYIAGRGVDFT